MKPDPWMFHGHPYVWATLLALGVAYSLVVRVPTWKCTRRQAVEFSSGLLVIAVATTWPVGDLAAHWSLTFLVIQRLLIILVVPPLLAGGTPRTFLASLTKPTLIDQLVSNCTKPAVAVALVTVTGVGTLVIPVVDAAATWMPVRVAVDAVLLAAGLVMWAPVLDFLPGTRRLTPLGKAAYLVVQSMLPGFFSVVWIFARHPLYHAFERTFGPLSPVGDQQLAGFAAKLGTIAVLWTVAGVVVTRSARREDSGDEGVGTLLWLDVQRDLERLERSRRQSAQDGRPTPWGITGRSSGWSPWLPPRSPTNDDVHEPIGEEPPRQPSSDIGPGTDVDDRGGLP